MGSKVIMRRGKFDMWSNLKEVEDIVFDIFSRLDVCTLAQCRAVSKQWLKWITTEDFANMHLNLSKKYPVFLIFPLSIDYIPFLFMNNKGEFFDNYGHDGVLEDPFPKIDFLHYPKMLCSYNGLICFTNNISVSEKVVRLDVYMCNPATWEVFLLPKPRPSRAEASFGVMFGSKVHEYKIFRFYKPVSKLKRVGYECEIYSSSSQLWRKIGSVSQCPMGSKHVFVDKKVFWFISSKEDSSISASILSVDWQEKFKKTSLPSNKGSKYSFLVDLEGRLSVILCYPDEDHMIEIWVLRNYDAGLWVKKCSINIPIGIKDFVQSVGVRKSKVFFVTKKVKLVFNLVSKNWNALEDDNILGNKIPTSIFSYVESLLPCTGVFRSF